MLEKMDDQEAKQHETVERGTAITFQNVVSILPRFEGTMTEACCQVKSVCLDAGKFSSTLHVSGTYLHSTTLHQVRSYTVMFVLMSEGAGAHFCEKRST
jgi:hypothetical protein